MRVIAGKYRHRALRAPRGLEVRPTSDRLRETLFNVLVAGRPEALEGTVWMEAAGVACDFFFLDPPYDDAEAYARTLGCLEKSRLLKPGAAVVVEHSKHFDPGARFGALTRYRELRQGDAVLSFYRLP
jgi:16S rRNA G966 N2-methylase RsmD